MGGNAMWVTVRRRLLQGLGLAAAGWVMASCQQGIDTERQAPKKVTLGDDIYGLLCDRLGAGVFAEDLTGASYQGVCHPNSKGKYENEVHEKILPPVKGDKAKRARKLSLAKMDALVRRRGDLVRAFNTVFPDIKIDNAKTDDPDDTIRLHDALMSFSQRLAPLYEKNPWDPGAEPLLPASTRSLGRLFNALAKSDEARAALSHMGGRQGYRPFHVALGAIRPALAYPELRAMSQAALKVLGPKGTAVPELGRLLSAAKHELMTAKEVVAPLPNLVVDKGKAQPNRPRTNIEMAASILLSEDPRFAEYSSEPSRFIARRDRRGFIVPVGNTPGKVGSVPAPFSDNDSDGYADVDVFGRFVDTSGAPVTLPAPFAFPGQTDGSFDEYGRPMQSPYQYIDTSRALTGALARTMLPMLDGTLYGAPGDPNAWASEHETLMYAMAGGYLQYGAREPAVYDHDAEQVLAAGTACPTGIGSDGLPVDHHCSSYLRFRGEDSPLADLAHAGAQLLADKDSDEILLSMMDLLENHEQVMARLIGALLRVRQIAGEHDKLAAQGAEAFAALPYEAPIWDEMGGIVARIVQRPGMATKLLAALASDEVVTPVGGVAHMGESIAVYMENRDKLRYDWNDINGPTVNLTDGGSSTEDPHNPVDRTAALSGDNRSVFHRSLQAIHDASGVKACNKNGAKVYTKIGPFDLEFPPVGGGYSECDLFSIPNLAGFYLDALLPISHPKRAEMNIKPGELNALLDLIGNFTDPDNLLASSSGITGMTRKPGPVALNRLVFFGASSDEFQNMPDHDTVNEGSKTNKFVSDLVEPVSPIVCPKKANGVPHCSSVPDLFRIRDGNTLFAWERVGFYGYLRPVVTVFANDACSDDLSICDKTDLSGEQIFIDMIDVLSRHWAGLEHGSECDKSGTPDSNHKYCSEAGVNTYEPLMVDAFRTDLIPALHEFAKAATQLSSITVQRGPNAGNTLSAAEVMEKMTKILFDPKYAASVKMVDRFGNKATAWTDGTPQAQLTPFSLFGDALHRIDVAFDHACSCDGLGGQDQADCQAAHDACRADAEIRKGQWKRARSQFVDAFFTVDGDGPDAAFHNPATVPMLLAVTRSLREQLNANCPNREFGTECTWAKTELGKKMAETASGPLFAGIMDVQEAMRANEDSRRELEKFMSYVLLAGTEGDALHAMLASMSDILQIIADDSDMSPIFQAAATAANPDDDKAGSGCADTTIKVMKALTSSDYDAYHVLDYVMPLIVTPMEDGTGPAPIEIFLDTIAEVDRIDADSTEPLEAADYEAVMGTVRDFMTSKTRGLEQFYRIVQSRPRE